MEKAPATFRVHNLPPFILGEIAQAVSAARNGGQDIIDLSQLNPNLGASGSAVEKLVQACLQPHNHRYSSSQGILKLREAIARYYSRRFEVELDVQSEVVVSLGTKQALSHLLFAAISPGDRVLLPTPAYPIHTALISLSGAELVPVQLPLEGSNVLDSNSDEFFAENST